MHNRALRAPVAVNGGGDPGGLSALQQAKGWHARVLYHLEHFEMAEREWRGLSEERERLFGASHPYALDARVNHAAALARLDRA